jgi:hypothetical protein
MLNSEFQPIRFWAARHMLFNPEFFKKGLICHCYFCHQNDQIGFNQLKSKSYKVGICWSFFERNMWWVAHSNQLNICGTIFGICLFVYTVPCSSDRNYLMTTYLKYPKWTMRIPMIKRGYITKIWTAYVREFHSFQEKHASHSC